MKQRIKVFLSHLLLSVILVLVALYLVYGIWYPRPLNVAVGVFYIPNHAKCGFYSWPIVYLYCI